MEKKLLDMKDISKTFGSVQALKGVSLDLYAGEVLALMGENGAGKSTLMNILSGSLQPTEGEIYLKGEKVHVSDPITAKKLGIAKIHQELQIVPELSVAENIFLGRWKSKAGPAVDFKGMIEESRKYLEMLDVKVDPAKKLKDLRIGEQQLVEIAKAISLNSEIIVMDEPTSAISEKEAEKLFNIIRRLRSEGKGIIYITHRMEEIFKIADRLTVMRDGQYIGTVRAAETTKDEIIKMMVGRDMSEQYPKDPTEKGEVALEVKELSYTPPEGSFRRSLKNISLYVRHGEVLGIAGLAGAGRSEFFECLAGVHHGETEGHIYIEGKEVSIKTPSDAIKAGISFATEDRKGTGLVLSRSIGENMSLPLLKKFSPMFFMKTSEEKNIWQKQMETLRIKAPGAKTLASSLSGGNQQKVVLAKWLMTEPKILLLDEPTRGIDVGAKAEIYQLINNLAKQGMAIIVVSSELPEVIGISDRIVTFCEGELTGEFLQKDATQEKLLESATK
ncbi:sugar ABC transporter ATP-binding protein [Blautia sp.]|jgi:ABC-type sugar transport system ATPase subunit|uniref:sugar ABC transporter ATP-binding protein n=1 Tax=Blautia sp. TaxID=1955243 RepID=UPI00280B07C1|nr:ATP-binding cassette domain-containing protein [Blautia sp.]MDY3017243.1 sugar ABC transporter ATP-binding protein [Blautia sp.]MED9881500.1 sugar ABC transporter ATP-binding protein [Blautia sp.]